MFCSVWARRVIMSSRHPILPLPRFTVPPLLSPRSPFFFPFALEDNCDVTRNDRLLNWPRCKSVNICAYASRRDEFWLLCVHVFRDSIYADNFFLYFDQINSFNISVSRMNFLFMHISYINSYVNTYIIIIIWFTRG